MHGKNNRGELNKIEYLLYTEKRHLAKNMIKESKQRSWERFIMEINNNHKNAMPSLCQVRLRKGEGEK